MTVSVMVIDDSILARHLMTKILKTDESIRIFASVADGNEALARLNQSRPDVITMDFNMPGLNGLELTKQIMQAGPIPILIVTTDRASASNPFFLLEAGATAVLRSPAPPGHPEHEETAKQLLDTIKAVARRHGIGIDQRKSTTHKRNTTNPAVPRCVAIGASTGGPQVLKKIIESLPKNFCLPILATQHISHGFTESFVKWLNGTSGPTVVLAQEGLLLEAGHVYVAPDNLHLGVSKDFRIELSAANDYPMRPAVGYMFRSMESAYGKHCAAIILTGMGRDGAAEMVKLRIKGALTIAQDKNSSLIFGMPGEAIAGGGASKIMNPDEIITHLLQLHSTFAYNSKI